MGVMHHYTKMKTFVIQLTLHATKKKTYQSSQYYQTEMFMLENDILHATAREGISRRTRESPVCVPLICLSVICHHMGCKLWLSFIKQAHVCVCGNRKEEIKISHVISLLLKRR